MEKVLRIVAEPGGFSALMLFVSIGYKVNIFEKKLILEEEIPQ